MMLRVVVLTLLSATILLASSIEFLNTIPRDNDKPVLVVVERDSCPWCIKMKNETLQDKAIIESLQGYHVVVMDQDRWNRLGFETVQSVPTMFFLDNEKRVILKIVGFWDAKDFGFNIQNANNRLKK